MTPGKPGSHSLASPSASDRDISLPEVPAPDHDPARDLWATPKLPVFPMPPPTAHAELIAAPEAPPELPDLLPAPLPAPASRSPEWAVVMAPLPLHHIRLATEL